MITVTPESFRLAEVFTISRGSRTESRVLTVTVTREGLSGRGECVPYARYGETLESVADQIATLPENLTRADLQTLLPAGAARNAVDCALWDLEAKDSGKRVWQLLGLPAPQPQVTAFTLSLDAPEKMRAAAARNAHRPLLKIKLGTPDDMARLEAVRAGAPATRIIVDANEAGRPTSTPNWPRICCVSAWRWSSSRCPRGRTSFWPRSPARCRSAPTRPATTGTRCPR